MLKYQLLILSMSICSVIKAQIPLTPSGGGTINSVTAGSGISISGTSDITVNATDTSTTNETLSNNDQTLAAERNITNNTFDLKISGSANTTRFAASGNILHGPLTNTLPLNNLHIINSGASVANGIVGRGITLTANNATPPSIYFESPDLTDASQLMGINFVSNAGLGLWKLASYNNAGSTVTVDNIITATHAGRVGIGNISPSAKLQVYEPITGNLDFQIANSSTGTTSTDGLIIDHDGTNVFIKNYESGTAGLYSSNGSVVVNGTKVGINTSAPISTFTNSGAALPTNGLSSSKSVSAQGIVWVCSPGTGYAAGIISGTAPGGGLLIRNSAGQSASHHSLAVVNGTSPQLICVGDLKTGINTDVPAEALDVNGNLQLKTAGNILKVKEGTNASMGTATLVSGTVTVSNTLVTANSRIFVTTQTPGGTLGVQYISARTAGASFTITSSSALDTSTVAWFIVEPAP